VVGGDNYSINSATYSRQSPLFSGHPTGLYRLKIFVLLDVLREAITPHPLGQKYFSKRK